MKENNTSLQKAVYQNDLEQRRGFGEFDLDRGIDESVQEELESLRKDVDDLKRELAMQENKREDNFEAKGENTETVTQSLSESVWNKFFYLSEVQPLTASVPGTGPDGTDTDIRRLTITDTENLINIDRNLKMRCSFFFGSAGESDPLYAQETTAYITTAHGRAPVDPTVYYPIEDDTSEFVGIKIKNGVVYLYAYNRGDFVEEITDVTVTGDTTHTLEIQYYQGQKANFYIDGDYKGAILEHLPSTSEELVACYPIYVSLERTDATAHSLNIDYVEYIQDRK